MSEKLTPAGICPVCLEECVQNRFLEEIPTHPEDEEKPPEFLECP